MLAKMTGALHANIINDLRRPHPFAAERVGFVAARLVTVPVGVPLLLFTRYHPIPDHEYMKDNSVGARLGSEAITWAMQAVYHGRAAREGIFHIHFHNHSGETGMSKTDRREIPNMVLGFQSVNREAAHGIVILSIDHASVWAWMPGQEEAVQAVSMSVIGSPLCVFESRWKK